jgi:predicted O-methyltransferase YrrM/tetratricopeptide (TPR) repeat protein
MNEQRELIQALLEGKPYFGPCMRAFQGLSVRHGYMRAVVELLAREQCRTELHVLEIGSWAGSSAITWAESVADLVGSGSVLCVDCWKMYQELELDASQHYSEMRKALQDALVYRLFLHNIKCSGLQGYIDHIVGFSSEVLPSLVGREFDIVYIDGSHRYENVLVDIRNSLPLLREGGILCGDDYELALGQVDQDSHRSVLEKGLDAAMDPVRKVVYHPGVTQAVADVFSYVATWEGFWCVRKQGSAFQLPDLSEFTICIPDHVRDRTKEMEIALIREHKKYNIIRRGDEFFALQQSLGDLRLFEEALGNTELPPVLFRGSSEEEIAGRIDSLAPEAPYGENKQDNAPLVLVREHNGYNIIKRGDGFFAIQQSLGNIQLFVETIGSRDLPPFLLCGSSEEEVSGRIDSLAPEAPRGKSGQEKAPPVLVREHNGYNIIRRGEEFLAIQQSLGDIQLFVETIGSRDLPPFLLCGSSEEEVAERIDSFAPEAPGGESGQEKVTPALEEIENNCMKFLKKEIPPQNECSPEIEHLFAGGNYSDVALLGREDDWRTHAARGLVGLTAKGIEGLEAFDLPEARYYQGVAHWIGNDEESALRCLSSLRGGMVDALVRLIKKKQISVLAQLVWVPGHMHDFIEVAKQDEKFSISNIGFSSRDVRYKTMAGVRSYYNTIRPPDFYITHMLEWHQLPYNLQQLPCPKFAHTSDYDAYLPTLLPRMKVFDAMLVSCGSEWDDVRPLSGRPTFTFPKCFGIPENLPPVFTGARTHDVFFSGSSFDPFFHEKASLFYKILKENRVKAKIVQGFLSQEDYYQELGSSKITLTFYRRPGGTVTRGLEALSMGCAVLAQRNSTIGLFTGPDQGVFTYSLSGDDIHVTTQQILKNWSEVSLQALQGAMTIRREFALPLVISQYLRFLTFLASRVTDRNEQSSTEVIFPKRLYFMRGGLPIFEDIVKDTKEFLHRYKASRPQGKGIDEADLDLARESVLEYAFYLENFGFQACEPHQHLLAKAMAIYSEAIAEEPQNLAVAFNYMRIGLLFGHEQDIRQARETGRTILERPRDSWRIGIEHDLFTWDFYNTLFNYRSYSGGMMEGIKKSDLDEPRLISLIRASTHHHLSFFENPVSNSYAAMEQDPDFPFYAFRHALLMLKEEDGDREKAIAILERLLNGSVLMGEAEAILREIMSNSSYYPAPEVETTLEEIAQAKKSCPLMGGYREYALHKRGDSLISEGNLLQHLEPKLNTGNHNLLSQTAAPPTLADQLAAHPFWRRHPICHRAARWLYWKLLKPGPRR